MSHKLQITVSDKIYAIIEREAEKEGAERILTYAGSLLSKCIAKMEREGKFNDGFG